MRMKRILAACALVAISTAMTGCALFGLTFATILTLLVVPVLYAIVFKVPYSKDVE
jgi:multidrug efflux pump subunit AcrB